MTQKELVDILKSTGVPVHFMAAPIGESVPFITYSIDYPNFGADDKVYQKIMDITITLYVLASELSVQQVLEEALSDYYWSSSTAFDDRENLFIITYEMEEIDNG